MTLRRRYIELLKNSLLNEIYLENEVRLLYIFSRLLEKEAIDSDVLRNIGRAMPALFDGVKTARQEGRLWYFVDIKGPDGTPHKVNLRNVCEFAHTMVGRKRLDNIESCLDAIRSDGIAGDLAETGVWRGGAAIFMRGYLAAWDMSDRTVWAADSFEGLPVPRMPEDAGYDFSATKMPILAISLDEVRDNFRRYDLLDDRVRFLKGWFCDTLPPSPIERLALLRLDGDLYESTRDALNALYDRVAPGGFIIVDDYGDFEPCRRAVDEFRQQRGIGEPVETIDWSGIFWRKA
jgi:hypothetical protein